MAIGELDTVLQNEVVGSGAVAVVYDLVVLSDNSFVLTVSNLDLTVDILGADHADLGHAHNGAVIGGSVVEGVEKAIQILGHNNEGIHSGAAFLLTAGEHSHHAHEHCNAQDHGKNSLFHRYSPLW